MQESLIDNPQLVQAFQDAKLAFAAGEFDRARALSAEVRETVRTAAKTLGTAPPRQQPKVSVIVVTYRDEPDFETSLGLIDAALHDDYEAILIDNGNPRAAKLLRERFPNWLYVEVGFNYGCSGGRNVGAYMARGEYLVFLDDDGLIEPRTIEALVGTLEDNDAVAVRGKVIPKNESSESTLSYDLGNVLKPALINAEGVSAFRRDRFLEVEGFDELLSGHEGRLLCAKLLRFVGPTAFLYEPDAVLRHDFASTPEATERKRQAYAYNLTYVEHVQPLAGSILGGLRRISETPRGSQGFLARRQYAHLTARRADPNLEAVSIITTARNAKPFMSEYARSLLSQTHQNFELVFVDDGSEDGTPEAVAALFEGDNRLKLVTTTASGRSAALNAALAAASHEICVIADADDLSLPYRVAASAMLLADQRLDCVSLYVFDETGAYRNGRPHGPDDIDFRVRILFGNPASFPAFAFRKSRFPIPFDTALEGGVDCDWIVRNFLAADLRGEVVPINGTYHRKHAGQISATKRDIQAAVASACVVAVHTSILGDLSSDEKRLAIVLSGWGSATSTDPQPLRHYAFRLLNAIAGRDQDLERAVGRAVHGRIAEIDLEVTRSQARAFRINAKRAERLRASKTRTPPSIRRAAVDLARALIRRLTKRKGG